MHTTPIPNISSTKQPLRTAQTEKCKALHAFPFQEQAVLFFHEIALSDFPATLSVRPSRSFQGNLPPKEAAPFPHCQEGSHSSHILLFSTFLRMG